MTTDAAVRHELVRVSREPVTYELRTDGVVEVRAVVSGPLLLDGAAFAPVDGPGPWAMKPTERTAPRTWELTRPDGTVHARLDVAKGRRGATTIHLPDGPGEVSFEPTDNVVLDTIKAMALADTGRFALRRGIEDLARTGDSRSTRGTRGELADGERRVQVLRVRQDASWRPAPVLACALLVFRLHVATTFRSI